MRLTPIAALGLAFVSSTVAAPSAVASVPLPPRFEIIDAPCPDTTLPSDGCALPDGRVYIKPGMPRGEWRWMRAHELGHVFDHELLSPYDHARFARLARVYGEWTGPGLAPDGQPAGPLSEDFADAYAACRRNVPPARDSGYGYAPSPRTQARVCAWIKRVASRYGDGTTR